MNGVGLTPSFIILSERCERRLKCIRVCPVNAIRVKDEGPKINWEICINCGECVKACPSRAIRPFLDTFTNIGQFEYKIAIPSPALYSHFGMNVTPSMIFSALKAIGFNEVFDISYICSGYVYALKSLLERDDVRKPIISSTCPVVIKLIQVKYPSLIPNLAPLLPPRHLASIIVEKRIIGDKKMDRRNVGIIYITPCASKLGEVKGSSPFSRLDGVMGIRSLYNNIAMVLKELKSFDEDVEVCSCGVRWATIGGASEVLGSSEVVMATGIRNVMHVLDDVENGALRGISFIECFACYDGCLGGPLVVEGEYSTRRKVLSIFKPSKDEPCDKVKEYIGEYLKTAEDAVEMWGIPEEGERQISKKVKVLVAKEELLPKLPGVDCGLCGAPSCEVFAEDVALGNLELKDCIFYKLKEKLREVEMELNLGRLKKRGGEE